MWKGTRNVYDRRSLPWDSKPVSRNYEVGTPSVRLKRSAAIILIQTRPYKASVTGFLGPQLPIYQTNLRLQHFPTASQTQQLNSVK